MIQRTWEAAERKTRSEGGIDAVAILAILSSTNAPLSTIIIEQYRPPVGAYVIGKFRSLDSWSLLRSINRSWVLSYRYRIARWYAPTRGGNIDLC